MGTGERVFSSASLVFISKAKERERERGSESMTETVWKAVLRSDEQILPPHFAQSGFYIEGSCCRLQTAKWSEHKT